MIKAQEIEPAYVEAKILQGETFELEVLSTLPATVINEENIAGGGTNMEVETANLDYNFVYTSDPDFVGESRFLIERYTILGTYRLYTEVVVKVVPSLLEAVHDVALLTNEQSEVIIDALANDILGNGSSTILSLDLVSNGSAEIVDNKIVFTTAIDYEGLTSFNYTIEDDSGYKSSGVVSVFVQGAESMAGSTLRYITSSSASVNIVVDEASYAIDNTNLLSLGRVTQSDNYYHTYQPNPTSLGVETFELVNESGDVITVIIEILDDGLSSLLIRDDLFYTSEGTTLTFDPRENDFSPDGLLLDYSDELYYDGSLFSYQPPDGYSGVENFYYTILDGQKEMTASIEIYVGNYLPQLDAYAFETYENTPFAIEYGSPILNYTWNTISSPSNGEMSLNTSSYATAACDVISGDRMAIYIPDNGFTGEDSFTIEYCADNGACKEVDITINVRPATENCPCFGNDCVWAGDADNDGKVSVKDILAIGYNYGEIGESRNEVSDEWGSNHAEDWAFQQDDSDINNKYADGNGDGIINSSDADALNANLRLYHNINLQEVLAQKEVPLSYVETSTGPYVVGDVITFDVYIGSQDIPVEDLRGIVFSTAFPIDKIDPESIKFTPDPTWIGQGSPIITAIDVNNGVLEVGIARTAGSGAYGEGRVGETRTVARVDSDGLRPGSEEIPIDIIFNQARVSNSTGKSFKIPGESLQLMLQLDKKTIDPDPQIVIYPNPSHELLTFYANNNDEIIDVLIYNTTGGLMSAYRDINDRSLEITHQLPQGIYTASIKTQKGFTVQKVQVVDVR